MAYASGYAMRYVRITEVLEIPESAMPKLLKAPLVPISLRPNAKAAPRFSIEEPLSTVGHCRLELQANGLRVRCSTN